MLVAGHIARRGSNTVRSEIDSNDSSSLTYTFLTHIIEVGSLKILSDCKLITTDREVMHVNSFVMALSMNISMASSLKAKGVFDSDLPVFFAMEPLEILIERIVNHIENALIDSTYINSLVKNYLLNKI